MAYKVFMNWPLTFFPAPRLSIPSNLIFIHALVNRLLFLIPVNNMLFHRIFFIFLLWQISTHSSVFNWHIISPLNYFLIQQTLSSSVVQLLLFPYRCPLAVLVTFLTFHSYLLSIPYSKLFEVSTTLLPLSFQALAQVIHALGLVE